MSETPNNSNDRTGGDREVDHIRRGGLRRLRAGLPLEVSASGDHPTRLTATSLPAFTSDVERQLAAARDAEHTALLMRADHRPLPLPAGQSGIGRWQIHPTIAERLSELHPDLSSIALSDRQLLIFVPSLLRRDDGEQLLARVQEHLSRDIVVDGLPHVLEPKVGGALLDHENPDASRLFEAAEIALGETDATHLHVLFHPYQRVRVDRQSELDAALRETLLEHQLSVALQPAIDLQSGAIVAIEAFARWDRGERGMVATPDLISTAARLGVLNRVSEQVLQKALFHVSDWVDDGRLDEVTLWLNMTTTDVLDRKLVRTILDGTKLNGKVKVGIELSPSSAPDAQAVLSTLRALSARGARAAIGDLGVGFASFSEAQQLPFDSVKLDRSLIAQISRNDIAADVVRHLLAIARALGLDATAQGIEQPDQLALIREMGCQNAQGFVFSKPLAPDSFAEFLQDWEPSKLSALIER